ncbi:MAG: DMT family transporter [Limnoraphis sp. WC205]|jgi:drug/metabolite transporter (DMT)-like permease|nr:DMT family transporter [Limnoraphis sp. WC205]
MIQLSLLTNFRGEFAALLAAFLWSLSSVVYSQAGQKISAIGLNLIKGVIAILFFLLTIILRGSLFPDIELTTVGLLLLSGIIGIAIGDSAYFTTLKCLGPRRALLMETLAPPLTAILAFIFLQERLPLSAWFGIILTVLGVAWVVTERVGDGVVGSTHLRRGLLFGLLAEICQAVGVILSHVALTQTEISPLWSTLLRLSGGTVILFLWLLIHRQNFDLILKPLQSRRTFLVIGLATFLGTYLGIWLQQTALKFTAAGIAQALSSTSPLFVLPIAASLGDRVSLRAILGAMIAIAGVVLLFQGSSN